MPLLYRSRVGQRFSTSFYVIYRCVTRNYYTHVKKTCPIELYKVEQQLLALRPHLLKRAHALGLTPDDAEDIVQVVFARMIRDLHKYNGNCSVTTWARVNLSNAAIDCYRQRRPTQQLTEIANTADPNATLDFDYALSTVRAEALQESIGSLSDRDIDLVYRRHFLDQSYKEISADLGMTVSHVGVSLFRAERRLRQQLYKDHPGLFE